jgi:predicted O-methyltransferase YrrM
VFEALRWLPDRAHLNDLVFRLEPITSDRWELGEEYLPLYKTRQLLDQFERFWASTSFRPRHILEVGIWGGGSTALWYAALKPERLVAIDLMAGADRPYFTRYVERNGLASALRTRWQTDQGDPGALRAVIDDELDGKLDLVIDDGSHLPVPTRTCFETLFPLLRPGGLYILEDWAWEHWPEFDDANHVWANQESLTQLVHDLVEVAGSSKTLFRSVTVYEGFTVVERGEDALDPATFRIADLIRRRFSRPTETAAPQDVKVLAFYLPQFYPIDENDAWWGKGYTEWSRVARAKSQFTGHYQPHVPERLGYYDLRHGATRRRQAELARTFGIQGFCYYYYWFGTKTLLERPLTEMLASGEPDFPFCLCWANENWTRRWDGAEHSLLIEQHYGPELDTAFIEDLLPYFRDPRYLRIGGAPVLVVYRPNSIPDPLATLARWRRTARAHGLPSLHLVAALTFGLDDPRPLGFDAAVEFPPHGENRITSACPIEAPDPEFSGHVYDFRSTVQHRLLAPRPPFRLYRTAMAGWDNTARLGHRGVVFHHASPQAYGEWLRAIVQMARREPPDHRLVFVNAWNEWAEGAHLEPDQRFGTAYLEATLAAQRM